MMGKPSRFHKFPGAIIFQCVPENTMGIHMFIEENAVDEFVISLILLQFRYIERISIYDSENRRKIMLECEYDLVTQKKARKQPIPSGRTTYIQSRQDNGAFQINFTVNDLNSVLHWLLHVVAGDMIGYKKICLEQTCNPPYELYWMIKPNELPG